MNIAKFGASSVGKVLGHCARATDDEGHYLTYDRAEGGGHIHRERTSENYEIGECHDAAWVKDRLKDVYQRPGQKGEPPQMLDVIVTLPKNEPRDPQHVRQFMQAAYDSCVRQFGRKNNIVGGWVHMDEASPHLHFCFLPIADRKPSKKRPEVTEKLAVREYFPTKSSLQKFHREVQRDVDAAIGRHVDLTFAERNKDRDMYNKMTQAELKAETARRAVLLELKNEEVEELKNTVKHVEKGIFSNEHAEMSRNTVRRIFEIAGQVDLFRQEAADNKKAREYAIERAEKAEKSAETSMEAAQRARRDAKREIEKMQESMRFFTSAPEDVQQTVRDYIERERQSDLRDQRDVQRDCVRACITAFRTDGRNGFVRAVQSVSQELDSIGIHGFKAQAAYVKSCLSAASSQIEREYHVDKKGNVTARREDVPIQQDGGAGATGGGGGGSWEADKADTDYLHSEGGFVSSGRLDEGHEDIGPWSMLSECAKADKEMERFIAETL